MTAMMINAIEGALRPLTGVHAASVDVATRQVRVSYDESVVTPAAPEGAIEEQGYEIPGSA